MHCARCKARKIWVYNPDETKNEYFTWKINMCKLSSGASSRKRNYDSVSRIHASSATTASLCLLAYLFRDWTAIFSWDFHARWRGRREQKWMIPVICWISPICKPNSLMHSRIVCVKKCNCSGPLCICDAIKFHFFGIYIHCVEVHRTSRWKKWKIVLFQMHCALLLTAYQPVIFDSRGR